MVWLTSVVSMAVVEVFFRRSMAAASSSCWSRRRYSASICSWPSSRRASGRTRPRTHNRYSQCRPLGAKRTSCPTIAVSAFDHHDISRSPFAVLHNAVSNGRLSPSCAISFREQLGSVCWRTVTINFLWFSGKIGGRCYKIRNEFDDS